MTIKLINNKQNKACSLQKNGTHRVYSNNSRKNTKLFICNREGFDKVLDRLRSFGYKECTEVKFDSYFDKKSIYEVVR